MKLKDAAMDQIVEVEGGDRYLVLPDGLVWIGNRDVEATDYADDLDEEDDCEVVGEVIWRDTPPEDAA